MLWIQGLKNAVFINRIFKNTVCALLSFRWWKIISIQLIGAGAVFSFFFFAYYICNKEGQPCDVRVPCCEVLWRGWKADIAIRREGGIWEIWRTIRCFEMGWQQMAVESLEQMAEMMERLLLPQIITLNRRIWIRYRVCFVQSLFDFASLQPIRFRLHVIWIYRHYIIFLFCSADAIGPTKRFNNNGVAAADGHDDKRVLFEPHCNPFVYRCDLNRTIDKVTVSWGMFLLYIFLFLFCLFAFKCIFLQRL